MRPARPHACRPLHRPWFFCRDLLTRSVGVLGGVTIAVSGHRTRSGKPALVAASHGSISQLPAVLAEAKVYLQGKSGASETRLFGAALPGTPCFVTFRHSGGLGGAVSFGARDQVPFFGGRGGRGATGWDASSILPSSPNPCANSSSPVPPSPPVCPP